MEIDTRTLFERSILAGIGLLSMTHENAQKIVDELSRRGEVHKDEAKDWVEDPIQRGEEERQSACKLIGDEVKSALDELGLVTKQDLQNLASRMEDLKTREGIRMANFCHAHLLSKFASLLISTYPYLYIAYGECRRPCHNCNGHGRC